MSKILIWETMSDIGGGQEITLRVTDILASDNELHYLIPAVGRLSDELEKRNIPYTLMGDQSMPKGTKGLKGLIKFFRLTLVAFFKGRKAVKSFKPDILYAPGPAALVWSAMCANKKTKVIWHLHHIFSSGPTLKLINFFSAKKCVRNIISVSDCVSKQIKNEKAQHKKITVYNPVDVDTTLPDIDLREEFPQLDTKLKIAQIGFITPTKNQLLSINIVKCLKERGEDVSLAIVGSVRDDDYKELILSKIKEYGIEENVVFTGYRHDISRIISTFDVLLVPSVEGFSLVAVQAMIKGVPVFSIDKSGCAEVVLKSNCGMLFSSDSDICEISDTLLKTSHFDVNKDKKKHSDFLSECSYDKFLSNITKLFS